MTVVARSRAPCDKHREMDLDADGAVEVLRHGTSAIALITCEHASAEIPHPWTLSPEDSWLEGTHWTFDLGARALSGELCEALETVGVLARFSRLVADPNRPTEADDLFRTTAGGRPIVMNLRVDAIDRDRRLALWEKYHRTLHREVERSRAETLLAVHTFTPVYEGVQREMEIGVLFDEEEELAQRVRAELASEGFHVAMNAPYSGKDGLMYSVDRHAKQHGRRALEIEVRQDLAVEGEVRRRIVRSLRRTLAGR
jgi:predicted N-formylglutamate amidohydrolase